MGSNHEPAWGEVEPGLNQLTHAVIGAAIEVHRELGPGLDEVLYEAAMDRELTIRKISFERQAIVPVVYKGAIVGDRRLDFIVERQLVLELKAVAELAPVHLAQLRTYLTITGLQLGLVINFNVTVLRDGIKRVIRH